MKIRLMDLIEGYNTTCKKIKLKEDALLCPIKNNLMMLDVSNFGGYADYVRKEKEICDKELVKLRENDKEYMWLLFQRDLFEKIMVDYDVDGYAYYLKKEYGDEEAGNEQKTNKEETAQDRKSHI